MPEGLVKCVILAGNSTLDILSCIFEDKPESPKRAVIEAELNRKGNRLKGVYCGVGIASIVMGAWTFRLRFPVNRGVRFSMGKETGQSTHPHTLGR